MWEQRQKSVDCSAVTRFKSIPLRVLPQRLTPAQAEGRGGCQSEAKTSQQLFNNSGTWSFGEWAFSKLDFGELIFTEPVFSAGTTAISQGCTPLCQSWAEGGGERRQCPALLDAPGGTLAGSPLFRALQGSWLSSSMVFALSLEDSGISPLSWGQLQTHGMSGLYLHPGSPLRTAVSFWPDSWFLSLANLVLCPSSASPCRPRNGCFGNQVNSLLSVLRTERPIRLPETASAGFCGARSCRPWWSRTKTKRCGVGKKTHRNLDRD